MVARKTAKKTDDVEMSVRRLFLQRFRQARFRSSFIVDAQAQRKRFAYSRNKYCTLIQMTNCVGLEVETILLAVWHA